MDNLTNDDLEHSSPCSVLCDPCLVAHRLFHGRHLRSRRSWIPVLACASSGTRQKYWRSFCFRGGPELQYDPPPCILTKCAASCNPHSIHCVMQLPVSVSSAPTFSVKTFLSSPNTHIYYILFIILFSNRRRWLHNCRDAATERRPTKPWAQDVRQPRLQAKITFASACCHF